MKRQYRRQLVVYPRNTVLVPIISKADSYQILDTNFLDQLAGHIMEKAGEMLSLK